MKLRSRLCAWWFRLNNPDPMRGIHPASKAERDLIEGRWRNR